MLLPGDSSSEAYPLHRSSSMYAEAGEKMQKECRWVHADPCEAAIDEPLLYQAWGKNQTFIFAFESPHLHRCGQHRRSSTLVSALSPTANTSAVAGGAAAEGVERVDVTDVTLQYTSDAAGVRRRRAAEGVDDAMLLDALAAARRELEQSPGSQL